MVSLRLNMSKEIKWDEKFNLHNEKIDEEHRWLLVALGKIIDDNFLKNSKDLNTFLSNFENKANIHFRDEEKLMIGMNYPGMEKHIEEHKEIQKNLSRLIIQGKEKGRSRKSTINMAEIMQAWLKGHFLETDKKFVNYVNTFHKEEVAY